MWERMPRLKALRVLPMTRTGRGVGPPQVEMLRAETMLIRSD
jgi:hypothetical protein